MTRRIARVPGSPAATLPQRAAQGFTLIEIAIVLVVMGLMLSAAAAAYVNMFGANRSRLAGDSALASMSDALVAFARTHNRLPCPDLDGSGNEGAAGACPASTEVGWYPYVATGLTNPAPAARAIYGVYRAAGADLVVASELTGDVAGASTYADGGDFIRKLTAAASVPATDTHIYTTGDGGPSGAENCATNVVGNPAFVVVLPGDDRDGDGKNVDGIHNTMPASGHCFVAPTRPMDSHSDDRSTAIGFYALAADLNR